MSHPHNELPEPLTKHQNDVYQYIKNQLIEENYSPTLLEVAKKFGVAVPTIQGTIQEIEFKGYITRRNGRKRLIALSGRTLKDLLSLKDAEISEEELDKIVQHAVEKDRKTRQS